MFDNGTRIGGLPNGAYFVYQAKPGVHKFTASTEATDEHVLTLEAGKTYYIRGEVTMGVMVGRPHLGHRGQQGSCGRDQRFAPGENEAVVASAASAGRQLFARAPSLDPRLRLRAWRLL